MGKTTSKKTFSWVHMQGVQISDSDGARQAWTWLQVRDLRTRMSDWKLGPSLNKFFHFVLIFYNRKLKTNYYKIQFYNLKAN